MEYLHHHAGYTRVHNPLTGNKDLQRLPGLVAIAYQHETSRCGDPHLHTHVIVPNRQARADGQLVSPRLQEPVSRGQGRRHHLPGHPAPPAARRARLRIARRSTRTPGWPRSPASTPTASKRGRNAPPGCANGRATTSSSSTANPPPRNWPPRRRPPARPSPNHWRGRSSKSSGAPTRAACAWTATHTSPRAPSARAHQRGALDRARIAEMAAHIDKPTFTRADMVELIGAQLPIDAPGDPRAAHRADRRQRRRAHQRAA